MRRLTALALALLLVVASRAGAQARRHPPEPAELHGSPESVERMYDFANAHGLPFYLTQTNVDEAVKHGRLVPLTGDSVYELTSGVGFSYATREAKQFVKEFAPQYQAACGAPLIVSSAVRPTNRQPRNANPHSVHPTGIAVDFRRPFAGACLDWVRGALAELERRGIIEATEEHHPVHLHVAVLVAPGGKVVLPNLVAGMVAARPTIPVQSSNALASTATGDVKLAKKDTSAKPSNAAPRTYVVKQGDTLWDIASRVGVSVQALTSANATLKTKHALKAGTTLIVPERTGL
jgi:LysM repeat protein